MKRIFYHIIIPVFITTAFFVIASMPVEVLGCRNRRLIAFIISFFSGLTALGAAIMLIKDRIGGDVKSHWWLSSLLILLIPVIALIILA